ncbi:hypothetical protein CFE70_006366 [Pyrenophora teres f. teres 0-1]|uniref:Uncharacterized protein n=2 Tax=Pyrenophora teres f. teres TaxID=97479 RepID=E3RRB7_PYRTT|nr:hypothetical protein PTT_11337 [Pyrenophora teres f. teres 0-1]KAE8827985.1 hypothetical protein HRS9139_07204 [Pyrenophora teres f. teres]CAA9962942.1 hypothetical protein PTMSG1_06310 [Pyrenophora teres f. maculata]KAE8830583.1 hypothetical protein PTNB85_07170 [Pyrenophora teres f. teres]KAE8857416.1 hypothetical protein PTNB29_08483 [Pyrenophora teres f. teres]
MPQHHTPHGTFSYPDAKSSFPEIPRVGFGRAVVIGIGAGFMGALVMTGTNKLEQLFTQRPSSYVPARTMGNHFSVSPDFYAKHSDLLNHLHHFGMGMLAGPVRSIMSFYGIIGPVAAFMHTGVRLLMDQVVENSAGVSAVPWTWPINEQVIDLVHKGTYALVTGYICDRMVRGVEWFNW